MQKRKVMFWRTQKIVKLNIANQRKKLWLLSGIGSGQKKVLMAQISQHLSFKYMEFVLTQNNVCEGNTEGLLTTQVENLHAISHFKTKHLVLWNTPKTLEPQWKNRLKELGRIRSGLRSQKVGLSRVKYFHAFVSSLNYVSPIGANSDKRRLGTG